MKMSFCENTAFSFFVILCMSAIVSSFRHFQINFQLIFTLMNIYKFQYGFYSKLVWKPE